MKHGIGAWVVMGLLAGCGGASGASSGGTTPARTPSAPASAAQFVAAIDAAAAGHPDARVFEVEIDDEHYVGFLEVEYFDGDLAREVFFDPGTMTVVAEQLDRHAPEEEAVHQEVRGHLVDGRGNLRAALSSGMLSRYADGAVQEVELTILDGHYVIAVEQLEAGARSTVYHGIDGTYLGTAEETLAYFTAHPGQGHF
jgi:hypothetical protein